MQKSNQRALNLAEFCLALLPLIGWMLVGFFHLEQFESRWILATSLISALISILSLHLSKNSLAESGRSVFRTLLFLIPTMEYAVLLIVLFTLRDPNLQHGSLMSIALGLLFILLGNVLPKTQPNPFFGVRTRWALENRENWIQTSRISG